MAATEHPRPLLTVPEAAARREGDLQAVRLGSGPQPPVRIDPDVLDDYIYGRPPPVATLDDGRDVPSSVPPEGDE